MTSRCLWIDNTDNGPFGSDWASDYDEALSFLTENRYDMISLSYDLNTWHHGREYTGFDVLLWLYEHRLEGGHTPTQIKIHSADTSAKSMMDEFIHSHLSQYPTRNDF